VTALQPRGVLTPGPVLIAYRHTVCRPAVVDIDRLKPWFGPEAGNAAPTSARGLPADVKELAPQSTYRWGEETDLRWVLIHLINETARHAGHADATRELLDGTTGE
jgi:Protein of unknown function (DUF664)